MKKVYLASDITQAQLVVNMLAQQWIPAHIENAHQAGGLGELAVSYPQVWVKREQDLPRAQAIIAVYEAEKNTTQIDTQCPQCGENNPASFDLCWACNADLD